MQVDVIQRQYDEVISAHYDDDPQDVSQKSLDRAAAQIASQSVFTSFDGATDSDAPKVLDVGVGTGKFLSRLMAESSSPVQPFGLDLSASMVAIARRRIPDLVAAVDDAANLDSHFSHHSFRLICTHFVTGFVPIEHLAPRIRTKLADGGYWSFVGATQAAFPQLRKRAQALSASRLARSRELDVGALISSPVDHESAMREIESHGFVIRESQQFEPEVVFENFDQFMEFGYWGGWLTPFVEYLGLHRAGSLLRLLLNATFFPLNDHHSVSVVLAQKAPV